MTKFIFSEIKIDPDKKVLWQEKLVPLFTDNIFNLLMSYWYKSVATLIYNILYIFTIISINFKIVISDW